MRDSPEVLLCLAVSALAALAAYGFYRWRGQARGRRVEKWVRQYLGARCGGLPGRLRIDCSDDERWPVVVAFDWPHAGARHRLRFMCQGLTSAFFLLSEGEVKHQGRPHLKGVGAREPGRRGPA